jgi:hypothetical protein
MWPVFLKIIKIQRDRILKNQHGSQKTLALFIKKIQYCLLKNQIRPAHFFHSIKCFNTGSRALQLL